MTTDPLRVLVVVDDTAEVEFLNRALQSSDTDVVIHPAASLDEASEQLTHKRPDVALLDLFLPDSYGLQTFTELHEAFPDIPFVIVTRTEDVGLAAQAVRAGARDFIFKGPANPAALMRSLTSAVERERVQIALRELSHFDELTGVYNRRGFTILAQQQLNVSKRSQQGILFIFADVDDMKSINNTYGYSEGDLALIEAAHAFRDSLRTCDSIGRFGGDEFTALLPGVSQTDAEQVESRVNRTLASRLSRDGRPYSLSMTLGTMWVDPLDSPNLSNLIDRPRIKKNRHRTALLQESV